GEQQRHQGKKGVERHPGCNEAEIVSRGLPEAERQDLAPVPKRQLEQRGRGDGPGCGRFRGCRHWNPTRRTSVGARRRSRDLCCLRAPALPLPCRRSTQSPSPGSGVKYFSNLPSSPLCSSASSGGSFFSVILGH